MLAVMENIDRLIPDKDLREFVKERGLGTPATRASIIEELIAAGYVQRKKKQLISTEYGRSFAASLPENVKSAELTAHWEQALSDIENGTGSAAYLLGEIIKTITSIISIEKSRETRGSGGFFRRDFRATGKRQGYAEKLCFLKGKQVQRCFRFGGYGAVR